MIVLYSADADLCENLSLLFRDRYHTITALSEAGLVNAVAGTSRTVLITDAGPTEHLCAMLVRLKLASAGLRVILLHAPRATDRAALAIAESVADAVLFKPVDAELIAARVNDFLAAVPDSTAHARP